MQKLKAELESIGKKEEPTDADVERIEKLTAEIKKLEASANILSGRRSLNEIEIAAQQDPLTSAALSSAGISAREYAKFFFAYLHARMFHGLKNSETIKKLPKEANVENITFVEQHGNEFEALMKEMEAFNKRYP